METWDILRHIWYVLIGVLLAGYSILDGFDLGIGTLFPFLAKNEDEKKSLHLLSFLPSHMLWIGQCLIHPIGGLSRNILNGSVIPVGLASIAHHENGKKPLDED